MARTFREGLFLAAAFKRATPWRREEWVAYNGAGNTKTLIVSYRVPASTYLLISSIIQRIALVHPTYAALLAPSGDLDLVRVGRFVYEIEGAEAVVDMQAEDLGLAIAPRGAGSAVLNRNICESPLWSVVVGPDRTLNVSLATLNAFPVGYTGSRFGIELEGWLVSEQAYDEAQKEVRGR